MKLEVKNVFGSIRLELTIEDGEERALLKEFIDALNGEPVDVTGEQVAAALYERKLVVESLGFDGLGIDSIAIESLGDAT